MKLKICSAIFLILQCNLLFSQTPPNIVFIIADDLGYADVSFTHPLFMEPSEFLPEVNTPNLDALAETGIIFTNAYNTSSVCSPTRHGFMLSQYSQRFGVYTPEVGGMGIPTIEDDGLGGINYINPFMPSYFKNPLDGVTDYFCGAFGKWHLGTDDVISNLTTGARENTSYNMTDGNGRGYGFPTNGPLSTSPTGGGSPWHALNKGFDRAFYFMGGGSDYWNHNGTHDDLFLWGDLDTRENPNGDSEVPIDEWSNAYQINPDRTPENYITNLITEQACNFIEDNASPTQPFFCYVAYNAPHSPSQAPYHMDTSGTLEVMGTLDGDRYDTSNPDWFPDPIWFFEQYPDMERPASSTNGSINNVRRTRSITMAMIYWLDQGVGKLVQKLKDEGVYDNTIIIFISDNGGASAMDANNKPLRGAKGTNFEGGNRVPFIFHWPDYLNTLPAGLQGNRLIEEPIITMDLLPTFLDAANIPQPAENSFEGTSFLPLIEGTTDKIHDYLYWRTSETETLGAVRLFKWKLVVTDTGQLLYNLENDLVEQNDLKDTYPEIANHLREKWDAWSTEVMGGQQSIIVPVNEDAHVDEGTPDTNLGAENFLRLQNSVNRVSRGYLKFDVPATTETITQVNLWVYSQNMDQDLTASIITDNSWTETGITFNNSPALGSDIATSTTTPGTWTTMDVSSYINGEGTYSIGLSQSTASTGRLASRENNNGNIPYLELVPFITPNLAPEFTTDTFNLGETTVGELYSISLANLADDPDFDSLTFIPICNPDWLTIESNGSISGTPTETGIVILYVVVTDGNGGSDLARFTLEVNETFSSVNSSLIHLY